MHTVYISIGSNTKDKKKYIRASIEKLQNITHVKKCSSPYRTKPYGLLNQPDFINMAVEAQTGLRPGKLLQKLQEIETSLGRVRTVRWGERTIDLDIIFYDSDIIRMKDLVIPHYDMHNRIFVLRPLLEICPEYVHPVLKKSISVLYNELMGKGAPELNS